MNKYDFIGSQETGVVILQFLIQNITATNITIRSISNKAWTSGIICNVLHKHESFLFNLMVCSTELIIICS